jgi:hypothetical protein
MSRPFDCGRHKWGAWRWWCRIGTVVSSGDELSWLAYIISQAMGEPTDHDRKWSARVRAEWDAIERSEP